MSAAVPFITLMPRIVEGRFVWLRTIYRVYRAGAVTLSLSIPGDAC